MVARCEMFRANVIRSSVGSSVQHISTESSFDYITNVDGRLLGLTFVIFVVDREQGKAILQLASEKE
jgi:hypothetical protein